MDLDTISDASGRSTLKSLYNQNCVQPEKANVDNVIDNAINIAIDRFVDIMFYQTIKSPISIYTVQRYNTLSKTENIPYSSEIRFPTFYTLPQNIQIGALTNEAKLKELKSLLLAFVSQDDIKHICETAQINNGVYTPSSALSGLWNAYWTAHASADLTTAAQGLNITALGNVVILQTVSDFSTRCNCSNIFSQPLAPQPGSQQTTNQQQQQQQQAQNYQTTYGQQTYANYCPKTFHYMLSDIFMNRYFIERYIPGTEQK